MKRFVGFLLIGVFGLAVAIPFLWVLLNSVKPGAELLASPWSWPTEFKWSNFSNAWATAKIGSYFFNSLLISAATISILIPISAMASYVLAKYPFKGSNIILNGFMSGLMIPQFLAIVPLFILTNQLHLFDTKVGLAAVYIAYSLPFTIFVLHGFFQQLPNELIEAAAIDGASDSRTFWRVMLPIARPGIMVALIFNIIGLWNEYGLALVLMPSEANKTLPIGLGNLTMTQQYAGDWGALFAGMVIVMFPIMVVYWIFRDRVHQAMLAGSIKG